MQITHDTVVDELIVAYSHTMDANNDNDEAMRMINAMADRIVALLSSDTLEAPQA